MRANAPEVIQTSAMDCGPAVLASVLGGFGAPVSYPRLREACQTDVDGTSIDTLEELANRFGLEAEQMMLPNDFVLGGSGRNLPCIAIVTLPNGLTHFVAVWRELFGFVQIMDPARGRSWMRKERFMDMLYQHQVSVPAEDWLAYARSEEFRAALLEGLGALGVARSHSDTLIADACRASTWQPLARLDAAIRMCRAIYSGPRSGKRQRPAAVTKMLGALLASPELLADEYFQVLPDGEADLVLKGAVIVRIASETEAVDQADPVVAHAQQGEERSVVQGLLDVCRELGMERVVTGLVSVSLLVGVVTFLEALVFRYLIGAEPPAELSLLVLIAFVVVAPLIAAVALESASMRLSQVLGRRLSTSMHARLLRKLPRMADSYFSSRLVSDLAERGHAISQVREIPEVLRQIMIAVGRITLVLIGLFWLLPDLFPLIALAGAVSLLAPALIFPALTERDLRARTHLGALSRFYLDSLRGSEAIWAHGASPSVRQEQESLLLGWVRAVIQQQRPALLFEGIQVLVLGGLCVLLVSLAVDSDMALGTVLLVAYWSLFVPVLSLQLTQSLKQLPALGNVARRVLELLEAPEEEIGEAADSRQTAPAGIGIEYLGVSVRRGDLALLDDVNVRIEPGERVAIVGASGSGKSSFLGTLLGWNRLDAGRLLIDGKPLEAKEAAALREQTAVIDPELYLWNRSLFDNVRYGLDEAESVESELALTGSELMNDLSRMDEGLATSAGENGSRLSGGEGQRLRVARGLARAGKRLILLDEPFTGMDAAQRLRVREAIEARWPEATLLFVSHNIRETTRFQRVLVFAHGRIVEDGAPQELLGLPGSRYRRMLEQETSLLSHLKDNPRWQHTHLERGEVVEP